KVIALETEDSALAVEAEPVDETGVADVMAEAETTTEPEPTPEIASKEVSRDLDVGTEPHVQEATPEQPLAPEDIVGKVAEQLVDAPQESQVVAVEEAFSEIQQQEVDDIQLAPEKVLVVEANPQSEAPEASSD